MNLRGKFSTSVFTSCTLHLDDRDKIFRCTSKYAQDGQWYDWCLVEWENSTNVIQTYPGLVLGFIQVGMKDCAIVQSSNDPISIEKMRNDFICKFTMPPNTPISVIEIKSISSPLCVFKIYMVATNLNISVHCLKGNGHDFFCDRIKTP